MDNKLQEQFKKHDLIMAANKKLSDNDQPFNAISQISLYFGICIQLCEKFTIEEIESIIADQANFVNKRIEERKKEQ